MTSTTLYCYYHIDLIRVYNIYVQFLTTYWYQPKSLLTARPFHSGSQPSPTGLSPQIRKGLCGLWEPQCTGELFGTLRVWSRGWGLVQSTESKSLWRLQCPTGERAKQCKQEGLAANTADVALKTQEHLGRDFAGDMSPTWVDRDTESWKIGFKW